MSENASSTKSNTSPKSDQIEIGALWKREGKTQKFLSGTINFEKLPEAQWKEFLKTRTLSALIFTNKFKQNEKHPDLRIFLSKPREGSQTPQKTAAPAPQAESDDGII